MHKKQRNSASSAKKQKQPNFRALATLKRKKNADLKKVQLEFKSLSDQEAKTGVQNSLTEASCGPNLHKVTCVEKKRMTLVHQWVLN